MSPDSLIDGSGPFHWAWRVGLHSFVAGLAFFAWSRHLTLPPGPARRRLLEVVLVLPLVTASIPGWLGPAFREGLAWFDGRRLLAFPLGIDGLVAGHLLLGIGGATAVLTFVQEVLPAFRRPRPVEGGGGVDLGRPSGTGWSDWEEAAIEVVEEEGLVAGLTGSPGRPRLLVSAELVEKLDPDALRMVVRHEKAHVGRAHWLLQHALFGARLVQFFNPIALWVFREYCVEIEISCDRAAVQGEDPRPLVRALLALYEETDPRDIASRGVLKRRIEILLGRRVAGDGELSGASLVAATLLLGLLLPWLV